MTTEQEQGWRETVAAALAGRPIPKVGDGCTEYCWSDQHAYTIVEVVSPTCIKVQRDNVKRIDENGRSESQDYEYTPNPEATTTVLVFKLTKRYPGVWVRKAEGVKGNKFVLGHRREYRDPSF